MRSDQEIKNDLENEMLWDRRVDASNIEMEVEDGKVRLKGTVPGITARRTATLLAWGIRGVREVDNLLTIQLPEAPDLPTDDEIRAGARQALSWNPDVHLEDIQLSVTAGVVQLEGTVDSYWKRWKAENLVSDLRGVLDVVDHLAVVPEDDHLDKDIARDIEYALERNIYVDAEKVIVRVEDGRVTLTGTVPTYFARSRADDIASFSPGVVALDNRITVFERPDRP